MYLNFYQLNNEPFNVTPDPAFLFLSSGHKEAFASIVYAVENRKGFMSITGEVGVGKTTRLRSYIKEIDPERLKTIYIINANVSFKGLLKIIFDELEIEPEVDEVFEMVNCLQQVLIREYKKGNNFVIIIDEVQNMPFETLENLRMLSNLETSTDKLVQILLIGQPEFEDMLEQSNLRQLKQRIAVRCTLFPLTKQESIAYIRHRLATVGADDAAIFTKGAIERLIKKAKGTPRILNILCDNALITGYGYQQRPITGRTVREVIADFEGKRKFPILRWGIASLIVFFLLIGAFLLYSHHNNIFSLVSNEDIYRETSFKSIEEKDIRPTQKKDSIEQIKQDFIVATLESPEGPDLPSVFHDGMNVVPIKNSDIYDDKREESLVSDNGHTEVVGQLLEVNADVNKAGTNGGCSPLFLASENGRTEIVKMLIDAGADVNKAREKDGATPLFVASEKGYTKVVKLLLDANADVNITRTDNGFTPLMFAAQEGLTEVVKLLLDARADVNVKADINGNEDSALSLGLLEGHTGIVKLLVEYGAKE